MTTKRRLRRARRFYNGGRRLEMLLSRDRSGFSRWDELSLTTQEVCFVAPQDRSPKKRMQRKMRDAERVAEFRVMAGF